MVKEEIQDFDNIFKTWLLDVIIATAPAPISGFSS